MSELDTGEISEYQTDCQNALKSYGEMNCIPSIKLFHMRDHIQLAYEKLPKSLASNKSEEMKRRKTKREYNEKKKSMFH